MLLGCIAVGVACGFINFTIYRVSKIPPWIAGLGMTMAYEAIVGIYSQARANKGLQVEFLRDENRILGSQPWIFIVLIICVVISYIIYNHTTIGINIRAIKRRLSQKALIMKSPFSAAHLLRLTESI